MRKGIKESTEVVSRMQYIENPKARKVADFLLQYSFFDNEGVYTNGAVLVPMFRVLDALAMIDHDNIEYCEAGS